MTWKRAPIPQLEVPAARPRRAPEEADEPRFNQYLVVKIGMFVAGGMALFFASTAFWAGGGASIRTVRHAEAERELDAILAELRGAWDPRARARIVDGIGAEEHLVGQLHRLLRMADHPMLPEAVQLAGAFGAEELGDAVIALVEHRNAGVRAEAVRAGEVFAPWQPEELESFMEDVIPVCVAALEVSAGSDDAPWDAVCSLLLSDVEEIRHAAENAISGTPPTDAVDQLWSMVKLGTTDEEMAALRALGRTTLVETFEDELTDLLWRSGDEAVLLALDVLATKAGELRQPGQLWALALDVSAATVVRARALHCLEKTRSFDADTVADAMFGFDPELQYHAARCLLVAGRPDGVRVLLDLIDSDEPDTVIATRRLLANLTGLSPGAQADDFAEALQERPWRGSKLPEPTFSF